MRGLHGHLAHEGQRSLRAYHEVSDDVEGVIEENKGEDIESRDVLDGIFVADTLQERNIRLHLVA